MIVLCCTSYLLPEWVDKEPTNKGEGEIEDDLNDDDIVVQLVDVEEEDHHDADEVDCKVKRHPEERWEDELVSWLADAKYQQAACDHWYDGEKDVNPFQTELNVVNLFWLLQWLTEPWVHVVIVLKTNLLQICSHYVVQGFRFDNKTSKKDDDVEEVKNYGNYCNGQATSPQLERTLLSCGWTIPHTELGESLLQGLTEQQQHRLKMIIMKWEKKALKELKSYT